MGNGIPGAELPPYELDECKSSPAPAAGLPAGAVVRSRPSELFTAVHFISTAHCVGSRAVVLPTGGRGGDRVIARM